MRHNRVKALVLLVVAATLLAWGALRRTHHVVAQSGEVFDVSDPLVIQATCIGGIHLGDYGVLSGDPTAWGETAGKECPT